jgi:hypothetical protein
MALRCDVAFGPRAASVAAAQLPPLICHFIA